MTLSEILTPLIEYAMLIILGLKNCLFSFIRVLSLDSDLSYTVTITINCPVSF